MNLLSGARRLASRPAASLIRAGLIRAGLIRAGLIRAGLIRIGDASSVGIGAGQQVAMSMGTMDAMMTRVAKKSRAYAARSERVVFDEADRALAGESKVRNRN